MGARKSGDTDVILLSDKAMVGNRLLGGTFNRPLNSFEKTVTQSEELSEARNLIGAKENDSSQVSVVSLKRK